MNDPKAYSAESVFDELLRILFFTAKGGRRRFEFDQGQEVQYVSEYVLHLLNTDATVEEKSQILKQVKIFDRREIKEEYLEIINSIKDKASKVSTLLDKIHLLLTDEYFYLKDQLEPELLKIIGQYNTWDQFVLDFISVRKKLQQRDLHSFWKALNVLVKHHKAGCVVMLDYVYNNERSLIHDFANLVRANYTDENYFYIQVERIWQLNDPFSGRTVVWMLTNGRDDKHEFYREIDFVYFDKIIKDKDYEAIDRLTYTIALYIYVNKPKTLKYISDLFLLEEKYRHTEHLIYTLLDYDKKIAEEFKEDLKELIFSSTLEIGINNHFYQYILSFLDNKFGFDTLLNYLIKRIEHLESKNEYLTFYLHETYRNTSLSEEQKEEYFIKVLEWYLSIQNSKRLLHEKLVQFFRPGNIITVTLSAKIKVLIEKNKNNSKLLLRIAEGIQSYETQNEEHLLLLITLAEVFLKCPNHKTKELQNVFGSDILYNAGMKSKSGFGAFPQDIERKDLLTKVLALPMSKPIAELLKKALLKVNSDIESESKEGDGW